MENKERMFRLLIVSLLDLDICQISICKDDEYTIEFRYGNITYFVRYVIDNDIIVLNYSLDDQLRMHFPMSQKGIISLVSILGIEIFVTE